MFHTVTIVGVGLMGGSIGLAIRRRGLAERVIGVERENLQRLVDWQLVDEATSDASSAIRQADLVLFCIPVQDITSAALRHAADYKEGAIITDVGSAKTEIVSTIEAHGISAFVGGHPMAGSDRAGPEHARHDLFQDRITILTRTQRTDVNALHRLCDFWQALGSRIRLMSPEKHDEAVAWVSHLPHLLAAALVDVLPPEWYSLTSTGFADTTRVAAGLPELWAGILTQNRDGVAAVLDQLIARLKQIQGILKQAETPELHALLSRARTVRDSLGR